MNDHDLLWFREYLREDIVRTTKEALTAKGWIQEGLARRVVTLQEKLAEVDAKLKEIAEA